MGQWVSRRRFIKLGLLGGVLLASAGLFAWPTRKSWRPRRALRVLDPREFAVLAAIAARTVVGPGADPISIAHEIDEQFVLQVPEAQRDLKRLLVLFENALMGALFDGRLRPFTHLDAAGQDAVLRAWRDSRLAVRRGGYVALRKMTTAVYYMAADTWDSIGYPGPPQIAT